MKTINFLFILFSIILLSSCTITQEFHFNKDFSGSYKSAIDMDQLISAMKSMDSSSTEMLDFKDSLDLMLDAANKKLQGIGINNLQAGWTDKNVMYLSYDFANLDVLNKALNNSSLGEKKDKSNKYFVFFEKKGKKLIYHGINPSEVSDEGKDLGVMKDYYKYKVVFTFDRKIKKSNNEKYKISEDRHKATLEAPLFDITKKEFNSSITFKLK